MIRYCFKTKSVDDCRHLHDLAPIGMPWWVTGYAIDGSYANIVCYLPDLVQLQHYWDDAYDIESEYRKEITYTDRFPKPAWIVTEGK